MYPVLGSALVLLVNAGRFALTADRSRGSFLAVVVLALLAWMAGAVTLNVATVFKHLESPERVPDAEFARVLVEGLKESSRPAILGFFALAIALGLIAVGAARAGARPRELAATKPPAG